MNNQCFWCQNQPIDCECRPGRVVRNMESTLAARDAEIAGLRKERDELLGEVHSCPKCGRKCKECECMERENSDLRSALAEAREAFKIIADCEVSPVCAECLKVAAAWLAKGEADGQ